MTHGGAGGPGRNFYEWLGEQRPRRDTVGEFARTAWEDADFPRRLASEVDLVNYMEGRGAHEDAVENAREAWGEFGEEASEFTQPDQIVDWDEEDEQRR